MLSIFIMETRGRFTKDEAWLDSIETHYSNMNATMKNLETQLGQLASELKNQQKGKFPSDMEQNSRDCKAITLRSGKEVEFSRQREERKEEEKAKKRMENEQDRQAKAVPSHCSEGPKSRGISFLENLPIISSPLPIHNSFKRRSLTHSSPNFLRSSRRFTSIFLLLTPLNKYKFMRSLWRRLWQRKGNWRTMKLWS